MTNTEVRARLQSCARAIASNVGEHTPFVLLVFADDVDRPGKQRCEYVSNGERGEIWHAVAEWVRKTSPKPFGDS